MLKLKVIPTKLQKLIKASIFLENHLFGGLKQKNILL